MMENDINAFIQSTNDGVQFEENLIHCKYVFSKVIEKYLPELAIWKITFDVSVFRRKGQI